MQDGRDNLVQLRLFLARRIGGNLMVRDSSAQDSSKSLFAEPNSLPDENVSTVTKDQILALDGERDFCCGSFR